MPYISSVTHAWRHVANEQCMEPKREEATHFIIFCLQCTSFTSIHRMMKRWEFAGRLISDSLGSVLTLYCLILLLFFTIVVLCLYVALTCHLCYLHLYHSLSNTCHALLVYFFPSLIYWCFWFFFFFQKTLKQWLATHITNNRTGVSMLRGV